MRVPESCAGCDLMRRARDGRERDARVEVDVDVDRAVRPLSRRGGARRAGCRLVSRPDRQRHAHGELPVVVRDDLLVFDLDVRDLARRNARDGHREEIRPLLFEQRGVAPFALRLLVDARGFLALLDLPFDRAHADLQSHRIDRRVVGERKHVDRLDASIGRILEALAHEAARDDAAHVEGDFGADGGRFDVNARLAGLEQQSRMLHGIDRDRLLGPRAERDEDQVEREGGVTFHVTQNLGSPQGVAEERSRNLRVAIAAGLWRTG